MRLSSYLVIMPDELLRGVFARAFLRILRRLGRRIYDDGEADDNDCDVFFSTELITVAKVFRFLPQRPRGQSASRRSSLFGRAVSLIAGEGKFDYLHT